MCSLQMISFIVYMLNFHEPHRDKFANTPPHFEPAAITTTPTRRNHGAQLYTNPRKGRLARRLTLLLLQLL
jgi:hypothetical protein